VTVICDDDSHLIVYHYSLFLDTPPPQGPITIDYVYDPLNRLTEANYSNNDYYYYTYDAVGNRKTQTLPLTG
jgi:YD repeat-containing protein